MKMREISERAECPETENQSKRSISKQFYLGLLTNFSSIAPSMSLGFSAVALPALTKQENPFALTLSQASWFASIASLSTPFGSIVSGPISDRFGRRSALFAINTICFIGWLIIAAAYYMTEGQYSMLLIGRLLTGFSTGLSSMPATVYMAEISTPKLRGVFITWSSISFSVGVLIVYTFGFLLKDNWGVISLITAAFPCIGLLFVVFFIPESPSWLVGKNRIDQAKRSMCHIFGTKDYNPQIDSEIQTLIQNKGYKPKLKQKTIPQQMLKKIKHLLKPTCLKPFALLLVFFFFQQFSGTFSIVFYAIDIVRDAGVQMDPYVAIVMIGLVRLLTAILMSYVSKKFGKRSLGIFSGAGMAFCMLILGGYILLIEQGKVTKNMQDNLAFLPVILLLLYFFTCTLGFLPLPFAMSAEVFPMKVRGTASGIMSGCGYFLNFITVKIYPDMVRSMYRQGVFFFYGSVALVGTLFVIFFLPETKGKTLQEIEEYFGSKKKSEEEMEELS